MYEELEPKPHWKPILVYMNKEEERKIRDIAKRWGTPLSKFCRYLIFRKIEEDEQELIKEKKREERLAKKEAKERAKQEERDRKFRKKYTTSSNKKEETKEVSKPKTKRNWVTNVII